MTEAAPVTAPVGHGVQVNAALSGFLAGCRAARAAAGDDPAARMRAAAMPASPTGALGPGDSHVQTGSPDVFINGLPAGRVGDLTDRGEVIVAGSSTVFINGRPAARLGDPTNKGGVIIGGSRTVFIGGGTTSIGALRPVMNPECGALAKAAALAVLANHAYGQDPAVPPGYAYLDPNTEAGRAALAEIGLKPLDLRRRQSSFRADVFKRDGVDGSQYVVAYKGTDPGKAEDDMTDVRQGLGMPTGQYKNAQQIARRIAQNPNVDVESTGHSLGGGLASAAAVTGDRPATTFNAAGLSANTVGGFPAQAPPVDAYYVSGEPLSSVQDHREMAIEGVGLLPVVGPVVLGFSAYRRWVQHSPILPRAYGTRHQLPRVAPPGKSAGDMRGFVAWHGMDWVMASIAGRRVALGCR